MPNHSSKNFLQPSANPEIITIFSIPCTDFFPDYKHAHYDISDSSKKAGHLIYYHIDRKPVKKIFVKLST